MEPRNVRSIVSTSVVNCFSVDSCFRMNPAGRMTQFFLMMSCLSLTVVPPVCPQAVDLSKPIDKRIYKGTQPTCHDFNQYSATAESVALIVGFSAGQVQYLDPIKKETSKLFNEEVFYLSACVCFGPCRGKWPGSLFVLLLLKPATIHQK